MSETKPTQERLNRQLKDAVFRWDAQKVTALLAAGAELCAMDDDALRWALMSERSIEAGRFTPPQWRRSDRGGATRIRTAADHELLKRMLEQELASRVVRPFNPRVRRHDGTV